METEDRRIVEEARGLRPDGLGELVELTQLGIAVHLPALSLPDLEPAVESIARLSWHALEEFDGTGRLAGWVFDLTGRQLGATRTATVDSTLTEAFRPISRQSSVRLPESGSRIDRQLHQDAACGTWTRAAYRGWCFAALRSLGYRPGQHRTRLSTTLIPITSNLLGRYQDTRDEEAFASMYTRIAPRIMAWAAVNGSRMDPEDLLAETWTRAVGSLQRFDSARDFTPWILGIARNVLLEFYRDQDRHRRGRTGDSRLADLPDSISGPLSKLGRKDQRERLERCIERIDPDSEDRQVLHLHLAGCSGSEIAGRMGLNPNTVHKRLSRLRQTFREWLGDEAD